MVMTVKEPKIESEEDDFESTTIDALCDPESLLDF